ncbi:MAG: DUF1905 domain-containing protein [Bacteroidota bacterium]
MQFTSVLAKFDSPLWGFHVKVPENVMACFLKENHKRVVCTLNGAVTFQAALMPNRNGYHFININKQTRDKLKLKIGTEVHVELKKDESKYGLPLPEEMEVLLQQDPEGDELFHALTPGKQRSLLYIIGKPKRSETRLKKAVVIMEHLKVNKGKIDFRRLNEDMKEANKI